MTRPTIGFAGLTHLGIVSAVATAAKGFQVVAFDPDSALAIRCEKHEPPIHEPGLQELVGDHRERLHFTSEIADVAACDVVFVAADVPTDDQGQSDIAPIDGLLDVVRPVIATEAVLVVLSQVPPGFTRGRARAERSVYCQVETLIFGRAVERALNPERIIVGCAEPSLDLPKPYLALLESFDCPILRMEYESAELTKISINMFLAASVTVTNTIAELCERIDANWPDIAAALKLDRRIGPYAYLAPGLGIAGGNLERDLATFIRLAETAGSQDAVVRAWIANSKHRRDWVLRVMHERVLAGTRNPRLAVLGMAYKADTHSTKNSPALSLLANLGAYNVATYDPAVRPEPGWHPKLIAASSVLEAVKDADAVVIMTPWAEFSELDPAALASRMAGRTVVDPFRVLDGAACRAAGIDYLTLGTPPLSNTKLNGPGNA